ncbi:MAG: hypothetical protein WEC75_09305 [Dehalococcoidia bacterium]
MQIASPIRLFIAAIAVAAGLGAAVPASATPGNGEGHTPITLCHYVPAHGGSYVIITVDDDAATGNKNGQGHMGHDDDIIPVNADGTCGTPDGEPD